MFWCVMPFEPFCQPTRLIWRECFVGLISFFHYLTDRSVCNIIYSFQTDQFIRDGLHSLARGTVRRDRAGGRANQWFYVPSHLAVSVLLFFPSEGRFHPFHDKAFRNACDCVMVCAIRSLDTVICPAVIFRSVGWSTSVASQSYF